MRLFANYTTRQGPLYLALAFQALILVLTFVTEYRRPYSVIGGCAAGSTGLLIRVIRDLRRPRAPEHVAPAAPTENGT